MLLNYDATWWVLWNYFWDFFIMGLNGQNFSEAKFSKSENIGFYMCVWGIFLPRLVSLGQELEKLKQANVLHIKPM